MTEISFETFSRKMAGAASQVQGAEAKMVFAGSVSVASDVAVAYRAATGGDGRLSGTQGSRRRNSAAASVSAKAKDVRKFADGNHVGLIVPTGAYGLIERPIAPHPIAAFTVDASKRDRAVLKALRGARKARAGGTDVSARQAAQLARIRANSCGGTNLRLPDGGFRRSVPHPGTTGRHVFSRTVAVAGPRAISKTRQELSRQLHAGYRAGK